ncbi:MAG: recombination regulator RecX [Clostridium sp.]|nr:recombination regulator RecX [Clostridium sp.]
MTKITDIKTNKKNKERVSIFVEGEFILACSNELVYKRSLKIGDKIDVETLKEIAKEDEFLKARGQAYKYLERTYKTEKEVRDNLEKKGYEENTIDRVILVLREYNLTDDYRYAEIFIKSKIRTNGMTKISYDLERKGISKEIISEAISNTMIEDDSVEKVEEERCYDIALKKYIQLKRREDDQYKLKGKLFTFLAGRGYDFDLINSVTEKILLEENN